MKFIVTEKAQRPARMDGCCFYCQEPIGSWHNKDCVLISKKVKVRMTIEYEISVPSFWDKEMVEYCRNKGTWCATNALDELKVLSGEGGRGGCLCNLAKFECINDEGEAYLEE